MSAVFTSDSDKRRQTGREPLRLLLNNEVARRIFDLIFNRRRIPFRQLLESEPTIGREELKEQLQQLVEEALVATTEVPIEDFQTYYVTRTGLTTERRLRQLQPG
jgi:DNA-binding HxlR family transcriptional regulator